jgi:hypothetical protein
MLTTGEEFVPSDVKNARALLFHLFQVPSMKVAKYYWYVIGVAILAIVVQFYRYETSWKLTIVSVLARIGDNPSTLTEIQQTVSFTVISLFTLFRESTQRKQCFGLQTRMMT